jgi:small multidrug resistance family-3 protein
MPKPLRSIALYAVAEMAGAWLVWQGVREHRGLAWIGAASPPWPRTAASPSCSPTRTSAACAGAYGAIFVAGSLAWGVVMDGFRPDRFDLLGAAICLAGVAVIMYAPRPR